MKKTTIILLFLTCSMGLSQTEFTCGWEPSSVMTPLLANFNENVEGPDDNRPYVFRIHYWQLVREDGTSDHLLSEQDFLESLALINRAYNQFNIFFKWDGHTDVPDDPEHAFYDITDREELITAGFYSYMYQNDRYVPGQLNIYTHNAGGGSSGQSAIDWAPINLNWQLIRHGAIIHEIGHNYGLGHTFDNEWDTDNPSPHNCEHQTRNPSYDDYNADTHADKLVGTYATPFNFWSYPGVFLDSDCNYDFDLSDAVDCAGEPYINPESKNYMSYTRFDCYREFKASQIAKMRFTIREVFLNGLESLRDTIHRKELYEPFAGQYYKVGPDVPKQPQFQPGFDYVFYDVLQAGHHPQPTPYDDTSFWYGQQVVSYSSNYEGSIIHQNHTAVQILQLDQNKVRMCYKQL